MSKQIEETRETLRVIRYPELFKMVPLCRSQIWRLEKQGHFPKSIPLGGNSKGWFLSDIEAWLNERRQAMA